MNYKTAKSRNESSGHSRGNQRHDIGKILLILAHGLGHELIVRFNFTSYMTVSASTNHVIHDKAAMVGKVEFLSKGKIN